MGDFENSNTAEQAAHDELHARAVSECGDESGYRSQQVAEATAALKAGQQTLDGCTDQKNRAVADLGFTKKVLAESQDLLEILGKARESEIAAFAEYEEAYNFNSAQMAEVVEVVESVLSGETSMIQLVRHSQAMLKNSIKLGATEKLASVMSILAQLSTGVTDEFLEQLRNVVNRIANDIEEDWNTATANELQHQQEYQELHDETEETIQNLVDTQALLEVSIANLNRCIVEQSGIVYSATARRDQHQRLWDEAAAYCETTENEYISSTAQRREHLDLLDTLRAKVAQRWGDFEDIERERVAKERAKKN